MGLNFYINDLKANFYNKIKAINSFTFKKKLFYITGWNFIFLNCTKCTLFNKKWKLAVKAILNNLLPRHSQRAAIPLSIGKNQLYI